MKGIVWPLIDMVSQLLEPEEREAVWGDLVEARENPWQGLLDVVGLVIRREAAVWKNWGPWVAAFGLALPGSLFLMGVSFRQPGFATVH